MHDHWTHDPDKQVFLTSLVKCREQVIHAQSALDPEFLSLNRIVHFHLRR